ncbi:hypothetical protein RvY_16402 [Ramazzottius varieornatus]|uniref:Uncharacterized protein n=1 Tax=Ramazzottius varieornatus TaxID=947166 RepID=A0A1D1W2N2_RAMVA|nr:hypothetical protein RvY_16402 [Ramazzottius varieornatus]
MVKINVIHCELRRMDCSTRKNIAALLTMYSQSSSIRAAQLLGFDRCRAIDSKENTAAPYQCEVVNSTVAVKHTECGYEPAVQNSIHPKKMMQCGRKKNPIIYSNPSAALYPQPDGVTYTENPSTVHAVRHWLSNERGPNIVERI